MAPFGELTESALDTRWDCQFLFQGHFSWSARRQPPGRIGTSTKAAMTDSRKSTLDALNAIEDQDPEEALRRYREQTQLNKPKDGERVSLMDRQSSTNQKGEEAFKQSERIIRSTAAMTDGLKARRSKCQEGIDNDVAALRLLEKELAEFERKHRAVANSHAARVSERGRLAAVLEDSKHRTRNLTVECSEWRAKNLRDTDRHTKKLASETLRGARGFGCDPGTTCSVKEALSRTRSGASLAASRRLGKTASAATLPHLPGSTESQMKALLATASASARTLKASKSAVL